MHILHGVLLSCFACCSVMARISPWHASSPLHDRLLWNRLLLFPVQIYTMVSLLLAGVGAGATAEARSMVVRNRSSDVRCFIGRNFLFRICFMTIVTWCSSHIFSFADCNYLYACFT